VSHETNLLCISMLINRPRGYLSLRYRHSAEFEVKLLEIALKGKDAFEIFKNKEDAH